VTKFRKKYLIFKFLPIFVWNKHIFPSKSPGYPRIQKIPKAIARTPEARKSLLWDQEAQTTPKGVKVLGYGGV
jgi:hypothetical protein